MPAVDPSTRFNSVAVEVTPSRMFSSAAVLVTPSSILSSAAVEVTPSSIFNSAAVAVTNVPPSFKPFEVSWEAMSKSYAPSAKVVLPVIVIVLPSAVKLSSAIFPTFVILPSLKDVVPVNVAPALIAYLLSVSVLV